MSNRVSRACDGCRLRKVRCNGSQPCSQCSHLDLKCVFPPAPGKRKPPVRGRLVAQLREQAQAEEEGAPRNGGGASLASNGGNDGSIMSSGHKGTSISGSSSIGASASSDSSSVHILGGPAVTTIAGILDPGHHHRLHHHHHHGAKYQSFPGHRLSLSLELSSDVYSPEFFQKLVPEYEETVYPVNPVITASEIRNSISNMHNSYEDAALIYAFGAVTVNLTRTSWHLQGDVASQMQDLLQRSLKAHRLVDMQGFDDTAGKGIFGEMRISCKRIVTCIFMEISLMAFERHDRTFEILRQAISMIQMLNVHKHTQDDEMPRWEVARRQRLYWELYIHERFLTMMSGYPSILQPLRTGPPFPDPSIKPSTELGFNRLINLFSTIDDEFLKYWNEHNDPTIDIPSMTPSWIENKQSQLDADERGAIEEEQNLIHSGKGVLTELQHADLFVTRLWCRTLVWELALNRNLLSTALRANAHEGLSVHYPTLRLSSQLRSLVSRLASVASIGTHGSGILQKLFDITTTIANVLNLPFGEGQTPEDFRMQMEDFFYLVRFLFQFERIQRSQRNYLRLELEKLQERYRAVVDFAALAGSSPDQ